MNAFQYKDGHLHAEDVPLEKIANDIGTPCYVYSQTGFEQCWKEFDKAFGNRAHTVRYSVKANSNLAILAVLVKLGAGFGVISGGEIRRVIDAGGNPNEIVFSGVGKSEDEIRLALNYDILCFNIESEAELFRIQEIASRSGKTARVSVRVNPNIDAMTHPHITTGLHQNKFGLPVEDAVRLYERASSMKNIRIHGIATHIGSQITSIEPFLDAVERELDIVDLMAEQNIDLHHLDLGGGLGIQYRDESPPAPAEYAKAICEVLDRRRITKPISIDPGRAIAANSGILLTRIEYIKTGAAKNFAVTDAAMNDLIRPVLYDAWMDIRSVQEYSGHSVKTYDVVGPVCETGDFFGKERKLAIAPGDLLAVHSAGAYGAVMGSNYNSRVRPPEVLVKGNTCNVIRKLETYEQMVANESIPSHLQSSQGS